MTERVVIQCDGISPAKIAVQSNCQSVDRMQWACLRRLKERCEKDKLYPESIAMAHSMGAGPFVDTPDGWLTVTWTVGLRRAEEWSFAEFLRAAGKAT